MAKDLFHVTQEQSANVVELALPQTLDSGEFDRLNESLLGRIGTEPHGRWVLDLSNLSYMGSSALGLMVNIRQRVKQADGRLVLCGMSPRLVQIFATCCLERLFTIRNTRQEALRAIR
jgi:anti-sigma B factor antagonist